MLSAAKVQPRRAEEQREGTEREKPSYSLHGILLGLCTSIDVLPRSGLTLAALILLASLPATISIVTVRRYKGAGWLVSLTILWFFATTLTQLIHDVAGRDVVAVATQPLIVLAVSVGSLWLFDRTRGSWVTIAGFVVGLLMASYLHRGGNFALDPWKYAIGGPITLAVMCLAAMSLFQGRTIRALAYIVSIAMVNLVLGFRSEALIAGLAGGMAIAIPRHGIERSHHLGRIVLTLILTIGVGYPIYGRLANSGTLGLNQQYKWEHQSRTLGGVLLGARPEFAASQVIIFDSPITGRGIGFHLEPHLQFEFLERLVDLGVPVTASTYRYFFGNGVYLHSALFQTWAESGLFTLPGLLLPLLLIVRAFRLALRNRSRGPGLIFAFLSLHVAWDLLFSPWPRLWASLLGFSAASALYFAPRAPSAISKCDDA